MKNKEAVIFTDKNFQFYATKVKGFKPYKSLHSHSFSLELQYFLSGSGSYFVKDKNYKVKAGSLLIIHANELHRLVSVENEAKIEKIAVNLAASIFDKYGWLKDFLSGSLLRCRKDLPHVISFAGEEAAQADHIMNGLVKEWNKKEPFWRETSVALFARLTVLVERSLRSGGCIRKTESAKDEVLQRASSYIDANIKSDLTLESIASAAGLSPNYLSSKFKKITGSSVKEYIIAKRINEAKVLLQSNKQQKIITIAYETGFKDLSHFNHTFKKVTGVAPTEYRELSL